jgi:cellulose synthase/poly-beta-1,6-N-acetylglucosamine synthase-like glycosyltransferase
MSSDAAHRARVPPVSTDGPRPLWSVMIPTFNCARYLADTLSSVLAQDPGPQIMQIEVVDDHSNEDDPEAVVRRIGRGRVQFHRQASNVGIARNFATCLNRSRGQLVHLLHGDDCVRGGFYAKLGQAFAAHPDIGAAFCRHIFMDADGHWLSLSALEQRASAILDKGLERLAQEQRIMTPSIVVRRAVYEELGGFDSRLICSEDWEMWVRIAARYPIWYEVEPLALYRMHAHSNTGRHVGTAQDMSYTRAAIEMFKNYLPEDRAESLTRKARETYALSAINAAGVLLATGDIAAARAQLREAMHLSHSLRVKSKIAWFLMRRITYIFGAVSSARHEPIRRTREQ